MTLNDCFSNRLENNKKTCLSSPAYWLVCMGLLISLFCSAQPLFTYGKHTVSAQSFLQAFNKNPEIGNRKEAMTAYLPLFIQYKLKVQDAYDNRLDTLPMLQQELFNYQAQLQESFILKQSNIEKLVDEAYERSKKDILLGHIFFPFKVADEGSINSAYSLSVNALAELKKGTSFDKVANEYNPNKLPENGIAGWITAFVLPYRFESAVYNAGKNGISEVVKGSDGFHLFKNVAERTAIGKTDVAQILLWLPQDADASAMKMQLQLADSLYKLLQNGADFGPLAMKYSNDRTSYASGGVLPSVGVGEYEPAFETAAFALGPNQLYSRPFRTSFGIHLLKYLGRPVSQNADEADDKAPIRQLVKNSDRASVAREDFLRSLQQKLHFKQGTFKPADLWQYSDSALKTKPLPVNGILPNTFLFSVGTEKVLVENWLLYLRGLPRSTAYDYEIIYAQYIQQTTENYYRENMAEIVPAFKAQLDEFKEANLLFQAMDTHVWTAANTDTAGLRSYYEAHKNKYTWSDGAQVLSITSPDSALAAAFKNQLLQHPNEWRKLAAKFRDGILADSARQEIAQLPTGNFENGIKPGTASKISINPLDNSASFTYIFSLQPGGDIRVLEDAKGWVISDYQQVLEQQWIATLKKKYPIKVNDAVWQQLLKVKNGE